eukprot:5531783-Pyramimonas_sp.AAC.1
MEVMCGNGERSACCRFSQTTFHLPEASPKPQSNICVLVESAQFSNDSPRPSDAASDGFAADVYADDGGDADDNGADAADDEDVGDDDHDDLEHTDDA